jgi:4-carboxymuconolactone decarboxylase
MAVRRKVLGDKHVARRQESPDRSSKQQDEVVTELAWGKIWSRPQLPLKLRSLVTIAMLAALNRADELNWARERRTRTTGRLLRRSSEVFVHGAAYLRFAASNTCVRLAVEVFRERGLV